jgi:hypothetical protein
VRHRKRCAAHRLYRFLNRIGIPLSSRTTNHPALAYDGSTISHNTKYILEILAHEAGHWLVASPERRTQKNYGLAGVTPFQAKKEEEYARSLAACILTSCDISTEAELDDFDSWNGLATKLVQVMQEAVTLSTWKPRPKIIKRTILHYIARQEKLYGKTVDTRLVRRSV